MNSPYAYILEVRHQPAVVFTWPNVARKYIRDTFSGTDGELTLPPDGYMTLTRYKVNPKAGQAVIITRIDIRKLCEG